MLLDGCDRALVVRALRGNLALRNLHQLVCSALRLVQKTGARCGEVILLRLDAVKARLGEGRCLLEVADLLDLRDALQKVGQEPLDGC